jgi:hypothetical protein
MTNAPESAGRRRLLKMGLAGGALLAVGGGAGLALKGGRSDLQVPDGLLVFSKASYPIMFSVVEAVIPDPSAAPWVTTAVDTSLSYAPPRVGKDLNLVLGLLENGLVGLFTRGGTTNFSLLSLDERRSALLRWRDKGGLLTGAYGALRKLPQGAYYADDAAAKTTGYPGPLFEKPPAPPIEERGPLSPPFKIGTYSPPTQGVPEGDPERGGEAKRDGGP